MSVAVNDSPQVPMLTIRRLEILVVVAICVVLFLLLAGQSSSQGYFSPDTLESQSRDFYWGIPGTASVTRHRLAEYLVTKGYWTPHSTTKPRWLMTYYYRPQWRDGHSALTSALFWHADKWIAWSEHHPERAAVLWPHVLEILRSNRDDSQSVVRELLWYVEHAGTEAEFDAAMMETQINTDQH
jgi:hypothetical protein